MWGEMETAFTSVALTQPEMDKLRAFPRPLNLEGPKIFQPDAQQGQEEENEPGNPQTYAVPSCLMTQTLKKVAEARTKKAAATGVPVRWFYDPIKRDLRVIQSLLFIDQT